MMRRTSLSPEKGAKNAKGGRSTHEEAKDAAEEAKKLMGNALQVPF